MSEAAPGVGRGSRQSKTNSAKAGSGADALDSENRPDVPTVEERVADFLTEYPERARRPVSEVHGRALRSEAVEVERRESEVEIEEYGRTTTMTVEEDVERSAREWVEVVEGFLEWYEGYRGRSLRLEKGRPDEPGYETLTTELDNSWSPAYQNQQYAQLKALSRETCGGERPAGDVTTGAFEEPVVVLLTRSASSTNADGRPRPPVDHDREVMEAWSEGGVRRSLRYVLDKAGVPPEAWVRWSQSEPHPNPEESHGEAAAYGHTHDMLIIDEAAVEGEVTEEMFRPVVDRHVEVCEGAESVAHGEDAVEVRDVGAEGVVAPANYLATYIAADSDEDLLERSTEYIAWASVQWATNSQRKKASDTVGWAVEADACRQRFDDPEEEQDTAHGAEVTRREIRGRPKIVCAACGSPWGIDQDRTLAEHRIGEPDAEPSAGGADGGAVVADGGADVVAWPNASEASSVAEPGECLWPSASGGARYGEPVHEPEENGPPVEREVFDWPARWRPDAVIEADGTERPVGPTGGVDMEQLKLRAAPEMIASMATRTVSVVKCVECGGAARDPWAWIDAHDSCGGVAVVGWMAKTQPPAATDEPVRLAELLPEEPPESPAEEPVGEASAGDDLREVMEFDAEAWAVEEYVEQNPEASVSEVMGHFLLPPEAEPAVEELVARPPGGEEGHG